MDCGTGYDIAKEMIDDFSYKHKEELEIDDVLLQEFVEYCDVVDKLADINIARCGEFAIGTGNTIIVKIVLPVLDASTKNSPFFYLIEKSIAFFIENINSEVVLTLVFPSLWKEKSTAN